MLQRSENIQVTGFTILNQGRSYRGGGINSPCPRCPHPPPPPPPTHTHTQSHVYICFNMLISRVCKWLHSHKNDYIIYICFKICFFFYAYLFVCLFVFCLTACSAGKWGPIFKVGGGGGPWLVSSIFLVHPSKNARPPVPPTGKILATPLYSTPPPPIDCSAYC